MTSSSRGQEQLNAHVDVDFFIKGLLCLFLLSRIRCEINVI